MALPKVTAPDLKAAISEIEDATEVQRGGQKIVFRSTVGGEPYALKVMLTNLLPADELSEEPSLATDEVTARASREVSILNQCQSNHIVKMGPIPLKIALINGQHVMYFTEEWIDGVNLRDILKLQGRLSPADVINLGLQSCEAIKELWSLHKIHRDIKPENIMRRRGNDEFVLLDMGMAFDIDADSLTTFGLLPGTPAYFCPERLDLARKRQMDFRSDLFSLGIVLFETATGEHPFWRRGMTEREVISQILSATPLSASAIRGDVPNRLLKNT